MTNKDLNLALDQNLIRPANVQHKAQHEQNTHEQHTHKNNTEATNLSAPTQSNPTIHPEQTRREPSKRNTSNTLPSSFPAWLAWTKQPPLIWLSATLLIVNALFLLWAGFWLSSHDQPATNAVKTTNRPIVKGINTKLETLDTQLLSLQQQLNQIKLSMGEQQQLIATSALDLNKDIQALAQQLQVAITPKVDIKKPDPIKKPPTKDWHVNLGTFAMRNAALKLQKQLSALGHSVQIDTTSIDNKTAYRVQLPGFKDRNSAEQVARRIMDQTNLNGLWAWKDE